MKIAFASRRLARSFEHLAEGVRQWGQPVALKYVQRVRDLRAASSIEEIQALRALRLHRLRGRRRDQWAIVLHGRWRLIVTFHDDIVRIEEVSNHYDD